LLRRQSRRRATASRRKKIRHRNHRRRKVISQDDLFAGLGKFSRNFIPARWFCNTMKDDENDDLWEFLGKAREPKVSSFFTANVMRRIREEEAQPKGFAAVVEWLRKKWFIPATAAAFGVALMAVAPERASVVFHEPTVDDMALAVAETSEFNMIAELDTLVAADHNAIWLEADPSSLF
jgi:hypothetical protein